MRSRYASACATLVTGGRRFGMMMARPNWRALCGTTARSAAPSRTCRCQSSGRTIVSSRVTRRLSHRARRPIFGRRSQPAQDGGGARLDAELLVDPLQVLLHGAVAAADDLAEFAVALAGGEPAHDLALAPRQQAFERARRRLVVEGATE